MKFTQYIIYNIKAPKVLKIGPKIKTMPSLERRYDVESKYIIKITFKFFIYLKGALKQKNCQKKLATFLV